MATKAELTSEIEATISRFVEQRKNINDPEDVFYQFLTTEIDANEAKLEALGMSEAQRRAQNIANAIRSHIPAELMAELPPVVTAFTRIVTLAGEDGHVSMGGYNINDEIATARFYASVLQAVSDNEATIAAMVSEPTKIQITLDPDRSLSISGLSESRQRRTVEYVTIDKVKRETPNGDDAEAGFANWPSELTGNAVRNWTEFMVENVAIGRILNREAFAKLRYKNGTDASGGYSSRNWEAILGNVYGFTLKEVNPSDGLPVDRKYD